MCFLMSVTSQTIKILIVHRYEPPRRMRKKGGFLHFGCPTYLVDQGGDNGQRRPLQRLVVRVRVADKHWGAKHRRDRSHNL